MAKIIDGDSITEATSGTATELTIDAAARTIRLNVAGNLVAKDGATMQAVYSKFIKLWETSTWNKYPFPFYALDNLSGQYQIGFDGNKYNTWKWYDNTTRTYIRDAGWTEYVASSPDASGQSSTGGIGRIYAGVVALGSVSAGSQEYYQLTSTGAPANFTYTDAANEGVQVYGDTAVDASTTTFDTRTFLKAYVREASKKYKDSVLADTGKTATGAYLVNVLLSNETDLDITVADGSIGTSPYSAINVKYFATAFTKDVDTAGTGRSFGIVVDVGTHSAVDGVTNGTALITTAAAGIVGADYVGGTVTVHEGAGKGTYTISGTPTATNVVTTTTIPGSESGVSFTLQRAAPISASLQQIYTKIQYLLRQNSNINGLASAGAVTGKTAALLLNFVGSALKAGFYAPTNPNGGGTGVTIQGYASADVNSFTSYDNTAVARDYPYAAAGTMSFNSVLTAGSTGYYRMYFFNPTASAGDAFGESGTVTVNDASGNPIQGTITSGTIAFTYDYTNNAQHSPTNTDVDVVVVAGNKGSAKPVVVSATLTASKAISIALSAEADRAYTA